MEASYPHDPPYKQHTFRQNLFQPSSPPRVSTDPLASSKKSHLHGLHHHHHRHHHRHSRHAKDVVQSAIQLQPPTSFGDLLKQASRSKDNSPSHSRRESVAQGEQDGEVKGPPPKPVRPEDVARERARAKARESELRSSLQTLSDQSLKTSRQLDDTYYAILEKVSVLRQTIGSLQDLSNLTKELHDNFQSDTKEFIEDIQGQFEGFNNFEAQDEQVKGLEERIKSGKERADVLTARLEEARKRVEARAKVEAEWEARTTRRLRVLWGILGTIAALVLVSILIQKLRPTHPTTDPRKALGFEKRGGLIDAPIPEDVKEAIIRSVPTPSSERLGPSLPTPVDAGEDPEMRIFDEL